MLDVMLYSPAHVAFRLGHPVVFASQRKPPDVAMPGNYFGMIFADSVSNALMVEQQRQGPVPQWSMVVTEGQRSYTFSGLGSSRYLRYRANTIS